MQGPERREPVEPTEELADWRDGLTAAELADLSAELDALPVIADPEAAWYAAGGPDRAADEPAGVSVFSAEEAGDSLGPGPLLAGLSQQAFDHGLTALSDDALIGLVRASRRLAAWQDGVELAAVAELDARRMAAAARPGSSRASEHVSEELAMALVLTGRSADVLLGLARELTRLPAVVTGLLDGTIDRARAAVFARELAALDDASARAIAAVFAGHAGTLTTGQLQIRLRTAVLRLDPQAARKRAQRARGEARVEAWQELSGNGALSGRELPAADMLAAVARITAIAQALKSAGAAGTLDQVRAAVFCALLAGRDPETLLPAAGPAGNGPDAGPRHGPGTTGRGMAWPAAPADPHGLTAGGQAGVGLSGAGVAGSGLTAGLAALAGSVHLTLPAATWLGWADAPGELPGYGPVDGWTARELADRLAGHPATRWHVTLTGPDGRAVAHACPRTPPPREYGPFRRGTPPRDTGPPQGSGPGGAGSPGSNVPPGSTGPPGRTGSPGSSGPLGSTGPPGGAGSPGSTGPLASTGPPGGARSPCGAGSLGSTRSPGGGAGSPDAAGPPSGMEPSDAAGPRGSAESWRRWLAGLEFAWLETGPCSHIRATPAYRPGIKLRELVTVRHRTCAFPGCRRPARHCDTDHTRAWEHGGPTCECNLAPLCRRHHRAKQGPGWHVEQASPGVLTWTAPHGRSYTVEADRYPV